MEPRAHRRWPIMLLVVLAAVGVIASALFGPGARKPGGLDPEVAATSAPAPASTDPSAAAAVTQASSAGAAIEANTAPAAPLGALRARNPGRAGAPASIGSLDATKARFRIDFSPSSAGIDRIIFSDFWVTAEDRARARAHAESVKRGDADPPALPSDDRRLALTRHGSLQGYEIPMLAARAIEIEGVSVSLYGDVWAATGAGAFATEVISGDAADPLLRVERSFAINESGDGFDLRLEQVVRNLSGRPLKVRWFQYGPGDLEKEGVRPNEGPLDIRRFQFGYLYGRQRDPQRQSVIVHGAMLDRADALKRTAADATHSALLWPQPDQRAQGFELSWFGTTNRYFAIAVHAADPTAPEGKVMRPVQEVWALADETAPPGGEQVVFTELRSEVVTVPAGGTASFALGAFPGPLDPRLLEGVQPFSALRMDGLILYLISGCCSFCTFAWLANAILWLLTFLHDHVVFDWALAIIVLVAMVRLALHPITRHSQIQMARVTKGMAAIKPELEALQKRHASDPKRMQQEQLRLYREKGVNPAGCVGGMLPTFLQMPIWVALYAVLYFAFELRQSPAFFGVFQQFGGWGFLGDLSAPDHFIEFREPLFTWPFSFESINVIPLVMSLVFWLQQKYMAPPNTGNLTPEQEQHQKMMKWMSVILFPIMLYAAPSGLTLYIMTSTCVGIIEGRRVRAQIQRMDFTPRKREPGKQDRLGKLYEAAMRRAQEKRDQGRRFKERD